MDVPLRDVLIALGSLVFLYLLYSLYRHYKRRQRKLISYLKRTSLVVPPRDAVPNSSAFSLSGNLVKEYSTPITEHYEITNLLLGKGSSAEVVIGKNLKSLRRYAVKIIDSSRRDIAWRYEREMNILKDCDHTNIIRLFELYTSPGRRHFVMELCTGGHLGHALKQTKLGRLEEDVARTYILQIVHSIAHCHNRGICHRDVKLQNILLESNSADAQLKLIDFGNACRFVGSCPMTKIVGTTYTAAPEVFRESYDERCDVWSIGVVAYILLSGRRPFESLDASHSIKGRESSVVSNILNGKFNFAHEAWTGVNSAAIHFIQCCLEGDYLKRRSAQGILDHPWLTHMDLHSSIGLGITRVGARRLSRRLSRNLTSSELRRTSMIAVAFNMSTQKQQIYREIFQQIDKSGSGVVDRKEFHAAMRTANPNMSKEDVNVLFDTIDQDGNNAISFTEFVAATVDPKEVNIEELKAAFRLLDKESKGFITKDDLRNVLSTSWAIDQDGGIDKENNPERQEKIEARIASMFKKACVNEDGVITYTEFLFAIADGSVDMQMREQDVQAERKLKDTTTAQASYQYGASPGHSASFTLVKDSEQQNFISSLVETQAASAGGEGASTSSAPPTDSNGASKISSFRARRQSDSVVKLSRTSFRQRASSIINFKRSGLQPNAETAASLKEVAAPAQEKAPAVPSMLTMVISDVAKAVGMNHNTGIILDDAARRESRLSTLEPVDNLEDSVESSQSDDSSEDEVAVFHSRRMSSPAMLWQNVKRRASMLIASSGPPAAATGDIESGVSREQVAGEPRERRRSSVRKARNPQLAGQVPLVTKTETATTASNVEASREDGGNYAVDDGLDSTSRDALDPLLYDLSEEVTSGKSKTGNLDGPEIGDSDVPPAPYSPEALSPVTSKRRQRGAIISRDTHGSGSSSVAALLEVSKRHSASTEDDDNDLSRSPRSGMSPFSVSEKVEAGELSPGRHRNVKSKNGGGGGRDSFTSAYSSLEENSFTNDSSTSDAEKLQELVHYLRAQQGAVVHIESSVKATSMATILEADERRMSKSDIPGTLPFSLSSMLSVAFTAGINAARGGNADKVVPSAGASAADNQNDSVSSLSVVRRLTR